MPRFWKGHNKGRVAVIYRAIRRVSVQGHDQENEAKAFKGEVRSKRGTEHRWYHAAFWYGVAYDGLSDFGSSLSRPLLVWLFSVVAFGAVYLWDARVDVPEWVKPCRFGEASKALRAFTLSIANALPVIGSSRSEEAKAFYSCVSSENIPVLESDNTNRPNTLERGVDFSLPARSAQSVQDQIALSAPPNCVCSSNAIRCRVSYSPAVVAELAREN